MPAVADFEERLGYQFRHPALLRLALTHSSVPHEAGGGQPDNQRLEFLGDSVLGLLLTHRLYEMFPDEQEGPLTKTRAGMVNEHALAGHARELDLGRFLILSRGEEQNGGRERASILADTFEAVIGAIYLDGGIEPARAFIHKIFHPPTNETHSLRVIENPKGELQELLQSRSPEPIVYRVESVTGPDHDRNFECSVHHQGVELGRGVGKSKRVAESAAALAALTRMRDANPA
ncbi:MAG: ribonuclease III [Verrucomicrobia bacterium]|nr:ribonuclease III [Verrucomicrobiota bacterium]